MNKDREKKIYYNLKENLLSVMSGLIIILLFKFILGDASNNLTEMVVIFGVAVVFFLPLEIAFIIKVLYKKPAIIISADGLYIDYLCKVPISWNHIEKIDLVTANPMKFIGLFLYKSTEYIPSMRLVPRLFGWYYKTPYVFSTNSVSIERDGLLLELNTHLLAHRKSNKEIHPTNE